jgi:hypothetical protein
MPPASAQAAPEVHVGEQPGAVQLVEASSGAPSVTIDVPPSEDEPRCPVLASGENRSKFSEHAATTVPATTATQPAVALNVRAIALIRRRASPRTPGVCTGRPRVGGEARLRFYLEYMDGAGRMRRDGSGTNRSLTHGPATGPGVRLRDRAELRAGLRARGARDERVRVRFRQVCAERRLHGHEWRRADAAGRGGLDSAAGVRWRPVGCHDERCSRRRRRRRQSHVRCRGQAVLRRQRVQRRRMLLGRSVPRSRCLAGQRCCLRRRRSGGLRRPGRAVLWRQRLQRRRMLRERWVRCEG